MKAWKFSFLTRWSTFCQSYFDICLTISSSWTDPYSTVDATDCFPENTSDWDCSARNSSNSSSYECCWLNNLGLYFICSSRESSTTWKSFGICSLITSLILSPLSCPIDEPVFTGYTKTDLLPISSVFIRSFSLPIFICNSSHARSNDSPFRIASSTCWKKALAVPCISFSGPD